MNDLPVLAIGSKNYSSWSLRPWLFLRKVEFAFQERIVHFDAADYKDQIARLSPSGRVPALQIDGAVICDSLAICASRVPWRARWRHRCTQASQPCASNAR
jgi:glutathione S-transferase